jgi:N-methylhydantoinase A
MIRIGFDIGGTFTDFAIHDSRTGLIHFAKVLSTPANLEEAVLAGIDRLTAEHDIRPRNITGMLHATTVATNAILERKGSRTALITTEGFRDILIIGRQKRANTNNLHMRKPSPLLKRRDIFEVRERIDARGAVVISLAPESVSAAIEAVRRGGYEAVAIVFVHAYANGDHECRVRDAFRTALPKISISVSHEVSPKHREYERTSTTVANAYVQPIVDRYIDRLATSIAGRGINSDLFIMQSNGGLVSTDRQDVHKSDKMPKLVLLTLPRCNLSRVIYSRQASAPGSGRPCLLRPRRAHSLYTSNKTKTCDYNFGM